MRELLGSECGPSSAIGESSTMADPGEREIVPVAYWRGEAWAAVLELWYRPPDPQPGFEPVGLDTDEQAYHWRDGQWEAAGGSGGGSWSDDLRLDAPPLAPGDVRGWGHGHYVRRRTPPGPDGTTCPRSCV